MCDLNLASLAEIGALPGVDHDQARALHLWRPYGCWGEIETVPGFDAEGVVRLRAAGAQISPVATSPWPPRLA